MSKKQQQYKVIPIEFSVKNMGSILEGKFTPKSLTVFCGPNNSGKTWVMYALYHFFYLAHSTKMYRFNEQILLNEPDEQQRKKLLREIFEETSLSEFDEELNNEISDFFNTSDELFNKTLFESNLTQEAWEEWMKNGIYSDVTLMPAERNGLHLFFRELSSKRAALLHQASKANIDIPKLLRNVMRSRYAQPIADYIDWLNLLTDPPNTKSDFHNEAQFLQKKLVQGAYNINRQTGDISYKPYKKKGISNKKMGLHVASSTVKSLFGLWYYLEYEAEVGDILMIDEPELNIHPENQLVIARLLARLVNAGIRVVISTHSDYIVREFNNLIMLSEDKDGSLKKEHNYQTQEVLNPDETGFYLFDNNTIEPFDYTPGQGFAITTFDEVISKQNFVSNDIYFELLENGQEEDE